MLLTEEQITSPPDGTSFRPRTESTISLAPKPGDRTGLHENIASADLQNPSDALEILAQVADRAEEGESPGSEQIPGLPRPKRLRPAPRSQDPSPPKMDDYIHYRPVQDGLISPDMIYHLFSRFDVQIFSNH